VFASVTGAPANAKDYPDVRVVSYVSRQDAKTVLTMAQAVKARKLVIPIERGAIVPPVSNSAVKVINRRRVTLDAPPWADSCSR